MIGNGEVKVWEESVVIPTYKVGKPNKNPMFLEKRVYQGSCGKVYPYPVIEKIYDEKEDVTYRAVYLENKYLKVMILPELGGRIQRAYDKTNGYDFVYYNHVIKPALVGLLGPWISGGIEFNWPQHHRPTTFMEVDRMLSDNPDGSKSVLCNDVDQMYGTKGIVRFTLYPDKAYIEITGQLYNRTNMPQTFLWWANPAVPVNDNTQSIFPPDVHAVMDHGKRDVSRFPIATGVYYKHDYSEGVDISRYKNIPVPTSYMAEKSGFDFVGGYDYGVGAGVLHVADHHVSPGKKQWTWGCGDFGKAWDRNLTDEDGPYIELMTGVFTDNQPDFTWLKPFEEKVFRQYFMPYKGVGAVKNATIHGAVNFEVSDGRGRITVYTTSEHPAAGLEVLFKGERIFKETIAVSPEKAYTTSAALKGGKDTDYTVRLLDEQGNILVAYTPLEEKIPELPSPAEAAKDPEEIMTNEELYLTGLHIEQYRHATYLPDDYYLEGLKRDPGDIRINTAYGSLLLSRGLFAESCGYFRKAVKRLTWKNPNPYDSEAYYKLGLGLFCQKQYDQAYDAFYKAAWSNEQQEMSYYYLGVIGCIRKQYAQALELVDKGLVKNWHNIKARGLKAVILRKLGRTREAGEWIRDNLAIDPFDYVSLSEMVYGLGEEEREEAAAVLNGRMRGFPGNYLQLARDYAEAGFYEEAAHVLRTCDACREDALSGYYLACYEKKAGMPIEEVRALYQKAEARDSYCCFPNKLEDIEVLRDCMEVLPDASYAPYYLGNLYYDKRQYEEAAGLWERSAGKNPDFPTVWRNLSLAYYNHMDEPDKALAAIEKAFALDPTDSRVFLEMDQLHKKLQYTPGQRLEYFEKYKETALERDDACIEYITLKNFVGHHEEAYKILTERKFHPWEGGEGKAAAQYVSALVEMAKREISRDNYAKAHELLKKALVYPENLGEGKLEGSKDNNINYYLGVTAEAMGDKKAALGYYEAASVGSDEVAGMMYYYDQPADMILYQGLAKYRLGKKAEGNARFYKLIDFGEQHVRDEVRIDYFAVSYPELMIYNEDFTRKNMAHCHYVIGLGNLGLGNMEKARESFERTLALDKSHNNCRLLLNGMDRQDDRV
ncbi:tetratricopeptide repeat protein [Clostridiales bacterium 1_7_47FAA]|uniref:DUF5107 domain-containing protein n=1 Tax=Enterocloster hominis (ex Hitch et al. 2024) TaxID=1917870 RepID=A0ABV1CZ78_9FIRM|nr:tetratricopeptide repeat protein [Clostridiales bacterium 1_7_47FAA]